MRDRHRLSRAVTENIRSGITFRRDDVAFTIRVRGEQRSPILSNMHLLSWGGESIDAETPGDSIISCITYNFASFCSVMVHSHEDEPCLLIVDLESKQVSKMSGFSIVPDGRNSAANSSQDAPDEDTHSVSKLHRRRVKNRQTRRMNGN